MAVKTIWAINVGKLLHSNFDVVKDKDEYGPGIWKISGTDQERLGFRKIGFQVYTVTFYIFFGITLNLVRWSLQKNNHSVLISWMQARFIWCISSFRKICMNNIIIIIIIIIKIQPLLHKNSKNVRCWRIRPRQVIG